MPIEDLKVKPEILSPKPPSLASDEEFAAGTSTTSSPTVKQAKEKLVTTDTTQTITGLKTFNNGPGNQRTNIFVVTDDGVGEDANNKWAGSIQFKKGNMDVGFCEALRNSSNAAIAQLMSFNSVNGQNIFSWLRAVVEDNGYAFASAPTPPVGVTGEEIVTAAWFNSKMQVVSALPANPDSNVFYFIPE